jgi:dihydroxyacetone kinase
MKWKWVSAIHGEPGRRRVALAPADAIADEMVGAIVKDLAPDKGAKPCFSSTDSAARRRWSCI